MPLNGNANMTREFFINVYDWLTRVIAHCEIGLYLFGGQSGSITVRVSGECLGARKK